MAGEPGQPIKKEGKAMDIPKKGANGRGDKGNESSSQSRKSKSLPDPNHKPVGMAYEVPMKDIRSPHPNDVLCGRGGGTNNHAGNEKFRDLVNQQKVLYLHSSKRDKPMVSRRIVQAVRAQVPPGRFLQKDETTSLWYDIGDQKAREKTSQALREGAPEIRREISIGGSAAATAATASAYAALTAGAPTPNIPSYPPYTDPNMMRRLNAMGMDGNPLMDPRQQPQRPMDEASSAPQQPGAPGEPPGDSNKVDDKQKLLQFQRNRRAAASINMPYPGTMPGLRQLPMQSVSFSHDMHVPTTPTTCTQMDSNHVIAQSRLLGIPDGQSLSTLPLHQQSALAAAGHFGPHAIPGAPGAMPPLAMGPMGPTWTSKDMTAARWMASAGQTYFGPDPSSMAGVLSADPHFVASEQINGPKDDPKKKNKKELPEPSEDLKKKLALSEVVARTVAEGTATVELMADDERAALYLEAGILGLDHNAMADEVANGTPEKSIVGKFLDDLNNNIANNNMQEEHNADVVAAAAAAVVMGEEQRGIKRENGDLQSGAKKLIKVVDPERFKDQDTPVTSRVVAALEAIGAL
mmetsp:Transcript_30210/g.46254  ORF Transcript_30210/g.46254 Transcript_30210/m.46254 type:complete len:577 (+) Transcript_30210:183-1913(+)